MTAPAADTTYVVTVLSPPDQVFEVLTDQWSGEEYTYEVMTDTPTGVEIDFVVTTSWAPPDQIFSVETIWAGGINLTDLTDDELLALADELTALCAECEVSIPDLEDAKNDAQAELDQAQQDYEDAKDNAFLPPTVDGETSVDAGRDGPDVVEIIAVELTIGIGPSPTGNGNDGIGIVTDWSIPVEIRFNTNQLIYVSGEKVAAEAQILELDSTGSIPDDGNGSLLATSEGIIIPDLFDPNVERNPDDVFFVSVAAAPPTKIFRTVVGPEVPNQIFDVRALAPAPDQIFDVQAVKVWSVYVAQPPFIVEVGPEPANQIFDVTTMARPADQIFTVTRGPNNPTQTFEVLTGTNFIVTTSFGIPDKIFLVSLGPAPAPTPDQIFGVSVGGNDAPPIPTPDEIFAVTTGVAIPDQIFDVKAITNHVVEVYNRFDVRVFAEPANQIFNVTTGAKAYDEVFSVEVGPEVPNQTFETLVIKELDVAVYKGAALYSLQEAQTNGVYNYVVTGEGLTFADSPTLEFEVGQQVRFSVNVPANTVWIKKEQEDGPGELDPYWGDMVNQGIQTGFLYARIWEPGTYYYQSEFNENVFGQINVTGAGSAEPDQIFEVAVGADPDGYDQIFDVIVGPSEPDQIFVTTVEGGAPPVHQTFEVKTWANVADEVFELKTAEPPLSFVVQSVGSSSYRFSGGDIPAQTFEDNYSINAQVGQLVQFSLTANGHPFWIKDVRETGQGELQPVFADYMLGNGNQLGVARVIFNEPGTYFYICNFHASMSGTITVTGQDDSPAQYNVIQAGVNYAMNGEDLDVNGEINPTIQTGVGQTIDFSIDTPGQPLWIKQKRTIGTGELAPIWANVMTGNGTAEGRLRVRFNQPGTYYYISQFDPRLSGEIVVT